MSWSRERGTLRGLRGPTEPPERPEASDSIARPYWAGLDGVRGLAVAAVLAYHGGFSWARGGFLGVSLFFTLSGFLITTIVVREHESTGRVSLSGFWARRARRLLPASMLALLLAMATTLVVVPLAQRPNAFGDIRAAALNFANWRFIWQDAPYVDANLVPSPVQHYWSLGIEEQFYLLLPLVAIATLRRGRTALCLGVVFGAVIALAIWTQVAVDVDVRERVYFGTDARAAELALGGLLALGRERVTALASGVARHLPDVCGVVGLAATFVLWASVRDTSGPLHGGGFAAFGVVSSLVVLGAVEGRLVPRLLSLPALRWLGAASYGVYLYHFPVYMLLGDGRLPQGRWLPFAGGAAVTLVLAAVSLSLLERPIRAGAMLSSRRAGLVLVSSLAVVLVGATFLPEEYSGRPGAVTLAAEVEILIGPRVAPARSRASTTTTASPATTAAPVAPSTSVVTRPPPRSPYVLVVGDSTAEGMSKGLAEWGTATGRLGVTSVTSPGCAVHLGLRLRVREGYEWTPSGCDTLFTTAAVLAREQDVDAIVVFIGSTQLADWNYAGSDSWHAITQHEVLVAYEAALGRSLAELTAVGVPVLWADLPTPEWDPEKFGAMLGRPPPGSGPVTMNDPIRAGLVNDADARIAQENPLVLVWPWRGHLAGADGKISEDMRSDGMHVTPERIPELAEGWLMDLLDESYDSVVARRPTGLGTVDDHAWSR